MLLPNAKLHASLTKLFRESSRLSQREAIFGWMDCNRQVSSQYGGLILPENCFVYIVLPKCSANMPSGLRNVRRQDCGWCVNIPLTHFEQCEFESIGACGTNIQVAEDEVTSLCTGVRTEEHQFVDAPCVDEPELMLCFTRCSDDTVVPVKSFSMGCVAGVWDTTSISTLQNQKGLCRNVAF